jgi:hypothetical protein
MYASKENAGRAIVIFASMRNKNPDEVNVSDVLFLESFLNACRDKLPQERSLIRAHRTKRAAHKIFPPFPSE